MASKTADIVLVHVPDRTLTHDQRRSIRCSLKEMGIENPIISDGCIQIGVPAPYQLTDTLGDYQISHGFPTEREMRRFEQKQKEGYWYDWENGESNHPDWGQLINGCFVTDWETGERVCRIYFYHEGTRYLERGDGVARIIETNRNLIVSATVMNELGERVPVEPKKESWRDLESLL